MSSVPSPERSSRNAVPRKRNEAVEKLGLSLPVTEEDVKQAFRKRARETHPDRGGAAAEFMEVQEAFEEAVEYAKRNGKRLPWIGSQVPIYVAQREAIELVESVRGRFVVETLDWLEDTVGGDFALMADRLKSIDLSGCVVGDGELSQLLADPSHLPFLETVNLADTRVSDTSAIRLTRLPSLRTLDLRGTKVSFPLRKQLAKLPHVEQVEGTSRLGEWLRRTK
ncbi:MAG: DnaJ domain-containing protein [Planctomycetota bacterium]